MTTSQTSYSASLPDTFPWPEVQSLTGLRRLHAMATTYHTRPSALVGVEDAYLAYCVDEMCFVVSCFPEKEEKQVSLYGSGFNAGQPRG